MAHAAREGGRRHPRHGRREPLRRGRRVRRAALARDPPQAAPPRLGRSPGAPAFLPACVGRRLMTTRLPRRRAAGSSCSPWPPSAWSVASRRRSASPPDRIAVTGDPRDDVLCAGPATIGGPCAASTWPSGRGDRLRRAVVLYAPTWRDGETDPSVPDDATWDEIVGWLEATDAVTGRPDAPAGRMATTRPAS